MGTKETSSPTSLNRKNYLIDPLSPWPFLGMYLFPVLTFCSLWLRGPVVFFSLFLLYAVVPLLEFLVGKDGYNPTKEESKELEERLAFRVITWTWCPAQFALLIYACCRVSILSTSAASLGEAPMEWAEFLGLAILVGSMCGAVGITVAHELIHKQNRFERNLGKLVLLGSCYQHFYIEHLLGHHRRVATREDPATARFGESVYFFIVRSVVGSYLSAWHLEAERLDKKNLPFWSHHNQMLQFIACPVAFCCFLYVLTGGAVSVAFFLLQSVIAFSLLEIVNYFEHYGLERKEKAGGTFEPVTPLHSWNADHRITNYLSFKLQRHSDHHTWPTKRYQTLRSWDFSPQLPLGYLGMIVLSSFPPLFHAIMDPKVMTYNALREIPPSSIDDSRDLFSTSKAH